MKGGITKDLKNIRHKKYFEQCYANKFNNIDKINKCFEIYKVPKFIQHETSNLNSPILNLYLKIFPQRRFKHR